MVSFEHDGLLFRGFDSGRTGFPIVFQHGLGGGNGQVTDSFPDDKKWRRLTLECRGHHDTPLGNPNNLSLETFARDVLAFATARGVNTFIAGGISMGAAIALKLAFLAPERVKALALVRPSWLWEKAPANLQALTEVSKWLRQDDLAAARQGFEASEVARDLSVRSFDNLQAMCQHFEVAKPKERALLLSAITNDGTGLTPENLATLQIPVLVVGIDLDVIHPLAYAQTLADVLPNAQLLTVTPKDTNKERYYCELKNGLAEFFDGVVGK